MHFMKREREYEGFCSGKEQKREKTMRSLPFNCFFFFSLTEGRLWNLFNQFNQMLDKDS
jgi:hypothetical protein